MLQWYGHNCMESLEVLQKQPTLRAFSGCNRSIKAVSCDRWYFSYPTFSFWRFSPKPKKRHKWPVLFRSSKKNTRVSIMSLHWLMYTEYPRGLLAAVLYASATTSLLLKIEMHQAFRDAALSSLQKYNDSTVMHLAVALRRLGILDSGLLITRILCQTSKPIPLTLMASILQPRHPSKLRCVCGMLLRYGCL